MKSPPTAGVLALQGSFAEHIAILEELGYPARPIRLPEQLDDIDALIIPGGESTTIGKLAVRYGLIEPIRRHAAAGLPIWGTCAGLIFLARDLGNSEQPRLDLMDITAARNAFGSQIQSFEADLDIPVLGDPPFHGVFIRAPIISATGDGVEILARLASGGVVAARQGSLLATAFHPELTGDSRLHDHFMARMKR
ncbi:MAG: pyridoxal 5'-phosphate synthase glutaminase subunit PdxT [Chloroflexota bacterium]|nr:pyridoxal 5'-phosphate synthase glutaminase subunit PdxT [Chloroflexota bacterium]MDP6507735.1 pyridoxal 5'-phosphate synthase glutaminase subunit PdxT [Chloroflexota bacterium]MDP6758247.1 pyridoxal 5'-phosphate synthase glutaminase subunit PdxT [Chloroflexota bacterium]